MLAASRQALGPVYGVPTSFEFLFKFPGVPLAKSVAQAPSIREPGISSTLGLGT